MNWTKRISLSNSIINDRYQSLKRSTFTLFSVYTVHSQCIYHAFTCALCSAPIVLTVHKAHAARSAFT